MPYPGTITTLLAAARIPAASSGDALFTGRASCAPAAAGATCPNAPNTTLVNDRFIALDMITERMNPDEPSSAPATISNLLPSTNPIAAAERPAYEFNSEITVGISAPPIGITSITPNSSAMPTITGYRWVAPGL